MRVMGEIGVPFEAEPFRAVRAGTRMLSTVTRQPVAPTNGVAVAARLTGGLRAVLSAEVYTAGRVSQRTGWLGAWDKVGGLTRSGRAFLDAPSHSPFG